MKDTTNYLTLHYFLPEMLGMETPLSFTISNKTYGHRYAGTQEKPVKQFNGVKADEGISIILQKNTKIRNNWYFTS